MLLYVLKLLGLVLKIESTVLFQQNRSQQNKSKKEESSLS
jgi:hypothetical protein